MLHVPALLQFPGQILSRIDDVKSSFYVNVCSLAIPEQSNPCNPELQLHLPVAKSQIPLPLHGKFEPGQVIPEIFRKYDILVIFVVTF